MPDSPVTSEDDEPLFDDPDTQKTPYQECTDGGTCLHGVKIATIFHFMHIFNLL